MDKEYLQSLYTPEQQLLIFGDANYFNNQDTNKLPFSIADLAAKSANVDVFPSPQDLYTGAIANNPTYLMKQAQNPFRTGITSSSPAIPFGTAVDKAQGFVEGSPSDTSYSPLGIDTSFGVANEPDVGVEEKKRSGLAGLFKALLGFAIPGSSLLLGGGMGSKALEGIKSLLDFSDSPGYRPATIGVGGYTPEELNKMNALGGYYSEPMRAYRRSAAGLSKI